MSTRGWGNPTVYDQILCYMVEAGEETREIPTVGYWQEPNGTQPAPDGTEGSCSEPGGNNTIVVFATDETDVMAVTLKELIEEQRKNPLGRILTDQQGDTGKPLKLDHNGCIVRRSSLDGSLQNVVSCSPRQHILHLSRYPRLAGHPGDTRVYYNVRRR